MKKKKLLFATCFSAVAAGALGLAACGDDGIVFQIACVSLPTVLIVKRLTDKAFETVEV